MFRRFQDQFIFIIIVTVITFLILGSYSLWGYSKLKNINLRSELVSKETALNVIKFKNHFDTNYLDALVLDQNLIPFETFKHEFNNREARKEEIISVLGIFPSVFKKEGGLSAKEQNFARELEGQFINLTLASREQNEIIKRIIQAKENEPEKKLDLDELSSKTNNANELLRLILLNIDSLSGANFEQFKETQSLFSRNIFIILIVFNLFSVGIMINTTLTIGSGINAILEGIKRFARNEYGYRIPLKSQNELGLIANYLNTAIANVEKLDELKTSFISIASHQIRTPLASTRWFSEMLLSGDAGPLNQFQKEFAEELHNGILRISDIVNTLLALSRIEAGKIKMQLITTDLVPFTQEIISSFFAQLQQKQLKIEFLPASPAGGPTPPLPIIQIDPNLLREVVSNLIANSIQYTEPGGIIKVKVAKKDNDIVYSVEDNGIGIPEHQQLQIFEKFFRADNARLKVPDGLGLGLNLIKRLIELWGGKVWFESESGKGTAFYFTIPIIKEIKE